MKRGSPYEAKQERSNRAKKSISPSRRRREVHAYLETDSANTLHINTNRFLPTRNTKSTQREREREWLELPLTLYVIYSYPRIERDKGRTKNQNMQERKKPNDAKYGKLTRLIYIRNRVFLF